MSFKGLTFWLSFVVSNCEFVTVGQMWYLIISIPDLCTLTYLEHQKEKEKANESTLKLPKFDMVSFSRDKLKRNEIWDSFESAIYKNKKLPKIENVNYLKSKLSGDAQKAI